ncbi:MAG: helix-turn-helix transcriptional regulator [Rhodobacteraceae bacterium]|nr:helix-turn-helix transcriptional regulator [Paracoccaceae bacterium]
MNQFPETLKTWRKARRFSQLDLAVEADVSSRHISFLETGRAKPSRDMIARLSDALDLPLASRNQMLNHAGFAVQYHKRDWDDQEMALIRVAVDHMLKQHAPFPAIAVDRMWTIFKMNGPAKRLFGLLDVSEGCSMLDLLTSGTLPSFVENWPDVAHHMAKRLRTESVAQGGVDAFDRTADYLSAVTHYVELPTCPVVPTIYKAGDLRLSLFSTIAQFGTALDLTLDDLKFELFFPADEDTKQVLFDMEGTIPSTEA